MTFPKTLLAFQEQFPDERACWQALRRMRWPHGFRCPRCGHRQSYRLAMPVEADETFVGGYERGRRGGRERLHKSIVVAAVERRPHAAGRVRLEVFERLRFAEDICPFVGRVIDARRAIVRTDGYAGYLGLAAVGIRHERRVQGPDRTRSAEILPWVHTVFGNLKTWLRGMFHGVSQKHLQRYLDEFTYRFDRRWHETELSGFVLARATRALPLPYARLTAERTG